MFRVWLACVALCVLAVLTVGLGAPARLAHAEDDTVTTRLQPGLNLAGWTQSAASVEAIFDEIRELELVYAWDADRQRFRWAGRLDSDVLGDLHTLTPGMGLWLFLTGDQPTNWTRAVVAQAGASSLLPGWNLVAWTGEEAAPRSDALRDLSEILTSVADDTGAAPSLLARGSAYWLHVSAPKMWEQPDPLPTVTPEMLAAIDALPWVRDGLTDEETRAVERLRYLARHSPQAFRDLIGKDWLREEPGDDEIWAVRYLANFAEFDQHAPELVAPMRFLETFEIEDRNTLDRINSVVVNDREGARQFLLDLAEDRDTASLRSVEVMQFYLESRGPSVASALNALPWYEDGIDPLEGGPGHTISDNRTYWNLNELFFIYLNSPEVFSTLLEREWMKKLPDRILHTGVFRIRALSATAPATTVSILEMPFLETWELQDLRALEFFSEIVGPGLDLLLRHLEPQGVTDEQARVLKWTFLQLVEAPAGLALGDLAWMSDGVTEAEALSAALVQRLAIEAEPVLLALADKAWMKDALSPEESDVVVSFWALGGDRGAVHDPELAIEISEMPFLEEVDGLDAAAMEGLVTLLWSGDGGRLERVLDHPTLAGGITGEATVQVAALRHTREHHQDLIEAILGPDVQVDYRALTLPLKGEVQISVLHLQPGSYRSIDILEEVVRSLEAFMLTPFPASYIGLSVVDFNSRRGFFSGSLASVDPGHEEDHHLIAHEVTHRYWPYSPAWISEGAAQFLADRFAGAEPLGDCSYGTLGEFDRTEDELVRQGIPVVGFSNVCAYRLGRDFFNDLYDTLGDEAFRQGFRRLYLSLRDLSYDAQCAGLEEGVCYVKKAFVADADPETAALAEPVINQRYYGDPEGSASEP